MIDSLLLAQSIKVTNWLTPVWIMSLGISLGFVLAILLMLKVWLSQRISFFNSVTENRITYWVIGFLTSAIYLGMFAGFIYWQNRGSLPPFSDLIQPLLFASPFCLVLGFGVWAVISRRMTGELNGLIREGFLSWVNKICIAMVVFMLLGVGLAMVNGFGIVNFVDNPGAMTQSLLRLPYAGSFSQEFAIEPSPKNHPGDKLPIQFHGSELQHLEISTQHYIDMSPVPITAQSMDSSVIQLEPINELPYVYRHRSDGSGWIPHEPIDALYINNLGRTTAHIKLSWKIAPAYREMAVVPFIALFVFAIYLYYLIFASVAPKVSAIAFSTFKTEVSQPIYIITLILGILFILGTVYVPYNTFGEDIKMYKDSGLTLIRVMAIFLAIWAASKSIAEEIEGRTALTVLSKPVGRRQFILGKFSGISLAIGVLFLILGLWFYIWTAYKPIYDFQEASKGIAEWTECFAEAIHILPGIFLCFLEVLIFVAISVAISTRMGIMGNFLICFSIYVLGHLTPLIVQSSIAAFEPVVVFGQLIAVIFPVLNHFDIQAAINSNSAVPLTYLVWSTIYTFLYGTITLLLALVLFEDRDLA